MKSLTLLVALLFAPAAFADDTHEAGETKAGPSAEKTEKLTNDELQVIAHYDHLNKMEVDLGKLAQKRGSRQAVKDYGAMLVKEHGASKEQFDALAKQHGQKIPAVSPASEVEKEQMKQAKAKAAKLGQLEGSEFDRQFLQMMVDDHERELAMIDSKIGQVKNTELADLVRAQKPILQKHADAARELQKGEPQAMR